MRPPICKTSIRKIQALCRLLRIRLRKATKQIWDRGARGEFIARVWLTWHGFIVWERNWRVAKIGEVDIVASVGRTLLIVEVKTRSQRSAEFLRPAAAVDSEKLQRLRQLGATYLKRRLAETRRARIHRCQVVTIEVIEARFCLPKINLLLEA